MMTNTCSSTVVHSRRLRRVVALVVLAGVIAVAERLGDAQSPDALRYSKSYTITGDYVVGAVDLTPARAVGAPPSRPCRAA